MMKLRNFLMYTLAAIMLSGCAEDAELRKAGTGINYNANAYVRRGKTEDPDQTSITDAAKRLEIPKLKNGEDNLFIVHTVPVIGVNYCMEYNCKKMCSYWTAYQWTRSNTKNPDGNWDRNKWKQGYTYGGYGGKGDPFQPDPLIPSEYRLDEYSFSSMTGGSFQRGHILGSADRLYSQEANGQTFYMSNMQPQIKAFNEQGIWFNLENYIRSNYNKDSFRDILYVVKGGTVEDGQCTYSTNGQGKRILIPKYFYMALLCQNGKPGNGGYKAIAFWMEHVGNTSKDYEAYAISIDELEKKTGIDFFCNLPDDIENAVEGSMTPSLWNLK